VTSIRERSYFLLNEKYRNEIVYFSEWSR